MGNWRKEQVSAWGVVALLVSVVVLLSWLDMGYGPQTAGSMTDYFLLSGRM